MFVLGIDPGLTRCGYGCAQSDGSEMSAVAAGVLETPPEWPVPQRLAALAEGLRELLEDLKPHVVAVERVFFQTNAKTAISVGQASGIALLSSVEAGIPVVEYTSNEVKLAVTGYGAAGKEQVQDMVARLLRLSGKPRPADAADALALAVCHLTIGPRVAKISKAVVN